MRFLIDMRFIVNGAFSRCRYILPYNNTFYHKWIRFPAAAAVFLAGHVSPVRRLFPWASTAYPLNSFFCLIGYVIFSLWVPFPRLNTISAGKYDLPVWTHFCLTIPYFRCMWFLRAEYLCSARHDFSSGHVSPMPISLNEYLFFDEYCFSKNKWHFSSPDRTWLAAT